MRGSFLVLAGLVASCTSYSEVQWGDGIAWEQARDRSQAQIHQLADAVITGREARRTARVQSDSPSPVASIPTSHRHVVMPGETLSGIAARYGVRFDRIAAMNGIGKPHTIFVGQEIWLRPKPEVPKVYHVAAGDTFLGVANRFGLRFDDVRSQNPTVDPNRLLVGQKLHLAPIRNMAPPQQTRVAELAKASRAELPDRSTSGFSWPVEGKIIDGFGAKPSGIRNDGINIAAALGATVQATDAGVVVYAGEAVPGMGRLLMIRHADDYLSAYGHNQTLLVTVGDRVKRGQPIAKVGRTGTVSEAQLHFQIRKGTEAIDPEDVLGRSGTRLASSQ